MSNYIEQSYMVFVEDENGLYHNNKNRFALRWEHPVHREVVSTLFNLANFKVSYVNITGEVFSNWLK